jgi:hypothetical protein
MEEPFMKKVILCLLAAGMFSLLACSSRTEILNYPFFPGMANDDSSTVYLFRESSAYGAAKASPIQFNGVQLFQIGNGDCVTFKIPTGRSEIIYVPQGLQLKFVSERGKKYYFYLRVVWGEADAEFRQLAEEEWNEKQKACNWVELKNKI